MREHRLLQPKRTEGRRRRPGFFEVTRPDELWHLDMTSIWVAEHVVLSGRGDRLLRPRDRRLGARRPLPPPRSQHGRRGRPAGPRRRSGRLTLGTDNGTAYTSGAFRAGWPNTVSCIAAAASATPKAWHSPNCGSASSSSAAPGQSSSRRSSRPAPRSAPTSSATTTGPTRGSPIRRRSTSRRAGRIPRTSQPTRPNRQRRRGPRHLAQDGGEIGECSGVEAAHGLAPERNAI